MTFAKMCGWETEVHRVDIGLIVPAASDVRAITELCYLQSEPIRVQFTAQNHTQ